MPIKMIAKRRYYSKADGREYEPGETLHVANEQDVRRLERMRRAERVPSEEPAREAPRRGRPPKSAVVTEEITSPPAVAEGGYYARRDMRSED